MARKRDSKGRFLKNAPSGNPRGRPKGSKNKITRDLFEALDRVETEKGISLLEHCIREAYGSEKLAIALMKKIIPDLKQVDAKIEAVVDGKVTISTNLELDDKLIQGLPNPPPLNEKSK